MKILMTNHQMERRGGSELFVDEVARMLRDDGHRVCVFSTLLGPLSSQLEDAGVPVVSDPSDCPFRPGIIHGQHHLETMTALCCWLDVPAIYYVHGSGPWEEHPPVHPRIRKYLGTAPRLAWWIAQECGAEEASVGTVRNFFDPARFHSVRSPDARSGRALVFHNQLTETGAAFRALRDACREADLECEALGSSFGRTVEEPGEILPEYDVVFAAGRSAIEAMACGCAVIPISTETFAERICPGNFDRMSDLNFCADANDPRIESPVVLEELRRLKPGETAAVTARIRREATLESSVKTLLAEYEAVLEDFAGASRGSSREEEFACLGRYLHSMAERVKGIDGRTRALRESVARESEGKERAVGRAEKWKRRAGRAESRLEWLEEAMEGGAWWRGRLWRRLRREWERREP